MADLFQLQMSTSKLSKKELDRFCKLGVLKWELESEWASCSFIVSKQSQTVQFVGDFREVNKWIVRNLFPIPSISSVLQELKGLTWATALDLSWVITPLD